ncbi:MAG TPA: SCO family protein [Gemmatimonadota bacterium]|nr:SCO family protein [Gemmatimonadota bacterium]
MNRTSALSRSALRDRSTAIVTAAAAPLGVLGLALLAGCGAGAGERAAAESVQPELRGTLLEPSWEKPDFTLADTDGRPFDFRAATDGLVTLLFFGYTHCPDVCPIHMANIAAVLRDLDYADRSRIRVVFVTTDPERDTAPVVRAWLDRFDRSFIGLLGTKAEVDGIQAALHLPAAIRQPSRPGPLPGAYAVGHAAQVIAFSADGRARVVSPVGTRQSDWAQDLPKLVAGGPWPAAGRGADATGR